LNGGILIKLYSILIILILFTITCNGVVDVSMETNESILYGGVVDVSMETNESPSYSSEIQPAVGLNPFQTYPTGDGRFISLEPNGNNKVDVWIRYNNYYPSPRDKYISTIYPAQIKRNLGLSDSSITKETCDSIERGLFLGEIVACGFSAGVCAGGVAGTGGLVTITLTGFLPAAITLPTASTATAAACVGALITCTKVGEDLVINLCDVIPDNGQTASITPPQLVYPAAGVQMPNGFYDNNYKFIWDFVWLPVTGATNYHLYVIGPNANIPLIDDYTAESKYKKENFGYIVDNNILGWKWWVRAYVNGEWSDYSTGNFDVLPPGDIPPGSDLPSSNGLEPAEEVIPSEEPAEEVEPAEEQFRLRDFAIAKDISDSHDPITKTNTFSTQDEKVVSWLRFYSDGDAHNIEWKWFSSNGDLIKSRYGDSHLKGKNKSPKCWDWVEIDNLNSQQIQGELWVDVYVDGEFLFRQTFRVEAEEVEPAEEPAEEPWCPDGCAVSIMTGECVCRGDCPSGYYYDPVDGCISEGSVPEAAVL
jgi:hypothetical protein